MRAIAGRPFPKRTHIRAGDRRSPLPQGTHIRRGDLRLPGPVTLPSALRALARERGAVGRDARQGSAADPHASAGRVRDARLGRGNAVVGGRQGLECRTRQPCCLAHVARSDVRTILYRRTAAGVAGSDDQVGLTGGTHGNGDGAKNPSRVAGAAECTATGDARDVASLNAASGATALKAGQIAGSHGGAHRDGQATATVREELAILGRRALRVSAGRPSGSGYSRPSSSGSSSSRPPRRDGASAGNSTPGWSSRARCSRTSSLSGMSGLGMQTSTGQTAAHASWS